mmetsp:Transcript_31635/g.72463  ORF Transcript_31635/g.72463 Transcript_31635/m.72463 type:complete len:224 (+) Transcript_31635:1847-2518(+)
MEGDKQIWQMEKMTYRSRHPKEWQRHRPEPTTTSPQARHIDSRPNRSERIYPIRSCRLSPRTPGRTATDVAPTSPATTIAVSNPHAGPVQHDSEETGTRLRRASPRSGPDPIPTAGTAGGSRSSGSRRWPSGRFRRRRRRRPGPRSVSEERDWSVRSSRVPARRKRGCANFGVGKRRAGSTWPSGRRGDCHFFGTHLQLRPAAFCIVFIRLSTFRLFASNVNS